MLAGRREGNVILRYTRLQHEVGHRQQACRYVARAVRPPGPAVAVPGHVVARRQRQPLLRPHRRTQAAAPPAPAGAGPGAASGAAAGRRGGARAAEAEGQVSELGQLRGHGVEWGWGGGGGGA
jgi:hypothetical protein